jgi:dihydropteroate synthase
MGADMVNRLIPLPNGSRLDLRVRPLVMGILNVTPDSFSDGGRHNEAARGLEHARAMIAEGADIIDIGGESTRPGHTPVAADEEIARIAPFIAPVAKEAVVSVDTMKAKVAAFALEQGAQIVNDVWGFQREPDLARVAADHGVACVLMHNRDREDASIDIIEDMLAFLSRSLDIAQKARIPLDRIMLDPGIGFGKTPEQNLAAVRGLSRLHQLGCPVLLGVSRKRIIGSITGRADPQDRMAGSLALHLLGAQAGADIIRVHDVAPHVDAMKMLAAFRT